MGLSLDNSKQCCVKLKLNMVGFQKDLVDSELNHLGKFVETKQRKLAYSVYCTMKVISAVLTTHSLLMSTKHLIVVGTRPE